MSLYLPEGCTQDALDAWLQGEGPEPERTDEQIEAQEEARFEWEAEMYFEWLDQAADRSANHLAAGIENRLAGSVASASVDSLREE